MKKYLFIMRHLPNYGAHVQETLDLLLTIAAFDQSVSVLLVDDGVLQLKNQQEAHVMQLRDTSAVFQALDIYDVKTIYVEAESIEERGLNLEELILPVQSLPRRSVSQFMQKYDVIIAD